MALDPTTSSACNHEAGATHTTSSTRGHEAGAAHAAAGAGNHPVPGAWPHVPLAPNSRS